ncbi:hypothetical protein ACFSKL_00310 [Belliella marina]|uniref:Uncharacterized protein n=1 Tax=Belliella marina TaxID=1644146 RepID=A0ABW4VI49_9BACT
MIFFLSNNSKLPIVALLAISSFALKSCNTSQTEANLKQLVTKYYNKEIPKGIIAIDLDKCRSCYTDIHEKIQVELATSPEYFIVILSKNRKNAHIFMKDYDINFIWDSLNISKPYFQENPFYVEN